MVMERIRYGSVLKVDHLNNVTHADCKYVMHNFVTK